MWILRRQNGQLKTLCFCHRTTYFDWSMEEAKTQTVFQALCHAGDIPMDIIRHSSTEQSKKCWGRLEERLLNKHLQP